MNKKGSVGLIVLLIIVSLGAIMAWWYALTYNSLITKNTAVNALYSQVETQYQRRADLIPNLVNATRGYLIHEQKVLIEVTKARNQYTNASTMNEKIQAGNALEGALSRLLVVIENYPNLKADGTVRALTDELSGTENRVNVARQRYNEGVQDYNVAIRIFPANFVARKYNFTEKIFFKSAEGSEKAPVVNLEVK